MKGLPKDETVWETYLDATMLERYIVTSKKTRDYYFLYEVSGAEYNKIGKARTPVELREKYMKGYGAEDVPDVKRRRRAKDEEGA